MACTPQHPRLNQVTLLICFHSMHLNYWDVKSFTSDKEETLRSASHTCLDTYPLSHEITDFVCNKMLWAVITLLVDKLQSLCLLTSSKKTSTLSLPVLILSSRPQGLLRAWDDIMRAEAAGALATRQAPFSVLCRDPCHPPNSPMRLALLAHPFFTWMGVSWDQPWPSSAWARDPHCHTTGLAWQQRGNWFTFFLQQASFHWWLVILTS